MAVKNATRFDEESLDETIILYNILNRRDLTSFYYVWPIRNYTELKKNVFYTKTAIDFYRTTTFKLVKTRGTLFVILYTNDVYKQVLFRLTNSKGLVVYGGKTTEIAAGLYISEFCRKAVEDSRFLCDDELKVQCRYEMELADHRMMVLPYGEFRDSADVFQLCVDFKQLYFTKRFADFTIYFHNMRFEVHKLVLATRSPYFCEMFSTGGSKSRMNCDIDVDPAVMFDVLLYLYSSELRAFSVNFMMGVFIVASEFLISCLQIRCVNYLIDEMTPQNVKEILALATHFQVEKLEIEASRFQKIYLRTVVPTQQREHSRQ